MPTLKEQLGSGEKRQQVIDDAIKVLDAEVSVALHDTTITSRYLGWTSVDSDSNRLWRPHSNRN